MLPEFTLKEWKEEASKTLLALRLMVHDDDLTELGELDHALVKLGVDVDIDFVPPRRPMVRMRIATDTPVGTSVLVLRDQNREILVTRTRADPWQLGHGAWVVAVDGISGGYSLDRVFYAGNLAVPEPTPGRDHLAPVVPLR